MSSSSLGGRRLPDEYAGEHVGRAGECREGRQAAGRDPPAGQRRRVVENGQRLRVGRLLPRAPPPTPAAGRVVAARHRDRAARGRVLADRPPRSRRIVPLSQVIQQVGGEKVSGTVSSRAA